jgi:hypothetical protein
MTDAASPASSPARAVWWDTEASNPNWIDLTPGTVEWMSTHPGATLPKAYADITPESDDRMLGVMDPGATVPSPDDAKAYFNMTGDAFNKAHGPVNLNNVKEFSGGRVTDDGLVVFNGQGWIKAEVELLSAGALHYVRAVALKHPDAFISDISFNDGSTLTLLDILVSRNEGWGRAHVLIVPSEGAFEDFVGWFKQ